MKFDHERLDRATQEAREKAKRELDYDDDGDVDADDFETKQGKRVLVIAAVVLLVVLAIIFGSPAKAEEGTVTIPMDCGEQVCVVPKDVLVAVIKAHNGAVEENRQLKAGKPAIDCRSMKKT